MKQQNVSVKFRAHYGLTQQELADLCNMGRSSVMNWEYRNGVPRSTAYILQTMLDQKLDAKQMVIKLKQIFDKPVDHKSI